MRIPLDYYRILGVPCQATDEQIEQAHEDRQRQFPHQEYSESAIAQRNELVEEAYRMLADVENRRSYDERFFDEISPNRVAPSEETPDRSDGLPAPRTPGLDIETGRLAGALSILQELGEYELASRLGEESLDEESLFSDRNDILLTIVLAYRELSRERWQDKEYESASEYLEKALALLNEENLFPALVREIDRDFYRLRPYRILELLSRELARTAERSRGLVLLSEMLDDRRGIDGGGDDRSGLGIDDFLRFLQQLRVHLTLEEQQRVFEREARRPSAVGEYLLVYVSIARGFARQDPDSILAAIESLDDLQKHQDVSLERAVCALLLGRVDLSTTILKKSQEKETLKYIEERSPDPDDLLPGLCDYGELWLRTEVFSRFRDLVDRPVSLKDYFADEGVQIYLEELSKFPNKKSASDHITRSADTLESEVTIITPQPEPDRSSLRGVSIMSESAYSYPEPRKPTRARTRQSSSLATLKNLPPDRDETSSSTGSGRGSLVVTAAYRQPPATGSRRRPGMERPTGRRAIEGRPAVPGAVPRRRKTRRGKLRLDRVAILVAGALGTLGAIGFGVKALVDSRSPLAALTGEQLAIELNAPVLEIPSLEARASEPVATAGLTKETAAEVIRAWLAAKAEAFGQGHKTAKLNEILVDPALKTWGDRASALKGNQYWKYEHQIEVRSVLINPKNDKLATVEAKVSEKARYMANNKEIASRSYDDTLNIRYELVRQGDKWRIRDTKLLSK
ncbi:IMS domain-containing protein [Pannus brasiliensis CCIBt3594]|uniref:IMS domain-containing protein n=1 Tax=Pannus brasiliensis CCIBt3594 TaxID=1427578 RepID=A0AAW9QUR1_9CHRO